MIQDPLSRLVYQFYPFTIGGPIRNELGDSKYFYDNWPVITTTGGTQDAPAYPVEYQMPSIKIHTPLPDEEFIEKLRRAIQEHFGIQGPLSKIGEVNIEEQKRDAPVPLRRSRCIERPE